MIGMADLAHHAVETARQLGIVELLIVRGRRTHTSMRYDRSALEMLAELPDAFDICRQWCEAFLLAMYPGYQPLPDEEIGARS